MQRAQVVTFRTYELLRRVIVAGTWCLVGAALMAVVLVPPQKAWHWLRSRLGAKGVDT